MHRDVYDNERSKSALDVTFVDDEAIAITASSSIALVERIAFVVDTVVSVFRKFAMEVNFSKGKTEAIVALRGKGARAAKTLMSSALSSDGIPVLTVPSSVAGGNV